MNHLRNTHDQPIIAVHLDLKGVVPRPGYWPLYLADLAGQGINAVLLEYEDVFPFTGIDVAWDSTTVWSQRTLTTFLRTAKELGIEIIPLQQCLGHLEYVFRWKRYRRFAENPAYPSTLCLSNAKGKALIREMLRQVMAAHPESRYIHLGMDEAHALATCPDCAAKGGVLETFLEYLRELIAITGEFGKTPLIWSDMLEDHFRADAFEEFKDKVVLCPWDYGVTGPRTQVGRIEGMRVSRAWLDDAADPAAPAIGPGTKFTEDLSPGTRAVVAEYLHDREFDALFQVDLWTKLGFRVLGAGAVRSSSHVPLLSPFNQLTRNLRTWAEAIVRTGQLGVIGTSWARGTTFCPTDMMPDLTWPLIGELGRAMGGHPAPFWPDLPAETVTRIVTQLGRCRDDWRLEGVIAAEMETLAPHVVTHRFEWDALALMARALELRRRADFAQLEVDYFDSGIRLVEPEWRRRLREQRRILADIRTLRAKIRRHFARRYHGEHFAEWLRMLFDLSERRLAECGEICLMKLEAARERYAR